MSKKNAGHWDDETVYMIAQRFNISREVVWRRLLTKQMISESVYRKEIFKLREQYKAQKQQEKKDKTIVVPYHTKVISTIGKFYTNLVLAGYHQEKITSSTLSEYLGIKLKHLPKVENAMLGVN